MLFPAVHGRFRAPCVLNKPLADIAEELSLGKQITQRALRRTFNDLARAARVDSLATRSISGHLTESMQQHYSTNAKPSRRSSASSRSPVRSDAPGGGRWGRWVGTRVRWVGFQG